MNMHKALIIYGTIFAVLLVGTFLVEIVCEKKPVLSALNDYKRVLLRSLLYFLMVVVASSILLTLCEAVSVVGRTLSDPHTPSINCNK